VTWRRHVRMGSKPVSISSRVFTGSLPERRLDEVPLFLFMDVQMGV
jgi:hypothetical protein